MNNFRSKSSEYGFTKRRKNLKLDICCFSNAVIFMQQLVEYSTMYQNFRNSSLHSRAQYRCFSINVEIHKNKYL